MPIADPNLEPTTERKVHGPFTAHLELTVAGVQAVLPQSEHCSICNAVCPDPDDALERYGDLYGDVDGVFTVLPLMGHRECLKLVATMTSQVIRLSNVAGIIAGPLGELFS